MIETTTCAVHSLGSGQQGLVLILVLVQLGAGRANLGVCREDRRLSESE